MIDRLSWNNFQRSSHEKYFLSRDFSDRFGGHGAYRSKSLASATLFTPLPESAGRLRTRGGYRLAAYG